MKGRLWIAVLLAMAVIAACKEKESGEDPAATAAKAYYGHLIAGRHADYLAGVAGSDSLPADYSEQLLANARQFMAQQEEKHGGIRSVSVLRTDSGDTGRSRNVFLLLCYGDSTREEVVIPMVETDGGWRMK